MSDERSVPAPGRFVDFHFLTNPFEWRWAAVEEDIAEKLAIQANERSLYATIDFNFPLKESAKALRQLAADLEHMAKLREQHFSREEVADDDEWSD